MDRREFVQAVSWSAVASALGVPLAARAQSFESIKILCGFPAGGTSDAVSRRIADKLRGDIAKASVVDNRTGAGGRIAVEALKASAPDGQTLLLTPYSMISLYPHIYKKLGYDSFVDAVPVCMGASFALALAVGPMVPDSVKTVNDFVAWCKANPTKANYGSPGAGSTPHFAGAILEKVAGIDFKHVGYRGSVPGVADVVGGQIASMFTPVGDFIPNHKAGKLRILATTETKRTRFTPDVPTFAESGYPDINWGEWFAFYAPGKTPAPIVEQLNAAINRALKQPDVIEGLATFALVPGGGSPADLARETRAEYERWAPITKRIGFQAD